MASSHPAPATCQWFARLAAPLDKRSAARLALLFLAAVLARGRRTVTTWIRAAGLSAQFRPCYTAVAAAGKKAETVAAYLVLWVVRPLAAGAERLTLAIDDTPTRRGPHVQGAGVHHNPTPGPAGAPFVYGHVFVVLGLLLAHEAWGVVALPLLSRLYVRKKDLPGIGAKHRPEFRTKPELAVELLRWAKPLLGSWGKPLWVVADGAYATKGVPQAGHLPGDDGGQPVAVRRRPAVATAGDPGGPAGPRPAAGLRPRPDQPGQAGGQRRGWTTGEFTLYGESVSKRYKTFPATWRPVGGVIRVVLVDEPTGWRAYFCTDPSASVADILTPVADRFSLEITFRDVKEVVGAGKQQVRFIRANVGAFHVCLWTITMTEAWAWGRPVTELVDRSDSPWDTPSRRPSHADKRRAWRRELLGEEIRAVLQPGVTEEEIQATAERLLSLAA